MTEVGLLEPRHLALALEARAAYRSLAPLADAHEPAELARAVAALGHYVHLVPAAYGGASARVDVRTLCVLREEMASVNAAADSLFAVQGLGSHPVVLAGNDAQRSALLPRVARGEVLFAFALTEPEAGSDVAALSTRATRDGDAYVLHGHKRFISNAGVATHYTVFARTGEGARGISAFVVPADAPGLRVSTELKLMAEHPIGELHFEGCRVPASARLGEEGQGMKLALGTLDIFRSTVGAAAVGMARRAQEEALHYARTRRQFGAPLAELPAVQALLADNAVELEAARLLVHKAAATKDAGAERITYEAAVGKLFATEAAQRIVDRALQVHGGNGVVRGMAVERLYRDVRALRIYEGASEVQRLVIARELLKRG
ncbi:acyl-CoA dehydrogenase [Aggregicoccus sp. 17bor-14]|uniref:acyl-CoA dehydrogenase family protein n=1 Tax=Myxococcaceae TaxID=31 RepID=UPI00129CB050|nr:MULTISPECIES: acyl-CoA dehydrogenase family protein [Myxococcaceae]MBF5043678.1 acyl-CoA dehydrogenase family protein [Simulacricoccus sp. 17bor-14]MRI89435.1 acyl-CoA dehydrogenase [Aggregicoccus sp. 17bor-14]